MRKEFFLWLKELLHVLNLLKRLKLTHIKLLKLIREARIKAVAALAKEFNHEGGWSKTSYAKPPDAEKVRSAAMNFIISRLWFLES